MKAISGFKDVQSFGSKQLPAGGYICRIVHVEDVPGKEYLKIDYDILEGEYAKYFEEWFNRIARQWWPGSFVKSYREKALSFFKQFFEAIDESNNTHFADQIDNGFDEKKLLNCKIGLILGYEEYSSKKDGSTKQRLYVKDTRPVEDISLGAFNVPELKTLSNPGKAFEKLTYNDLDLPF
ncbi:MAG: DUF669 domain-containing protein [Coprobacillus sp.]|nr:DUF669 domain-containing protein [Coprobacillus sp.]